MQNLVLGMKGPEVTIWQNFLSSRNIPTTPDGVFGPLTAEHTKLWQFRAGVPSTGVVDDATEQKAGQFGMSFPATANNPLSPIVTTKVVSQPPLSALSLYPEDWDAITKINEAKLARISPVVAQRVRDFIMYAKSEANLTLQVVQGLRTFAEQDSLYAQGRTKAGKVVTNARGGQSLHNYGVAVDLAPVINGEISWDDSKFKQFGQWAIEAGLDWGGSWKRFKDMPHIQDTDHMNLAKVQQLYREGGLSRVWANVT
jgi:LAS superfamily LD-carboxypeptidase LdcB